MKLTLKQARLLSEKSQKNMAEAIGVHIQTYRKMEEKPESITVYQAKKISEILKLSVDELFLNQ